MGDITIFDIQNVIDKCKLECFCETGTLHGDAINFIKQFSFKTIISIEIVESLALKAADRFVEDLRVRIVNDDSSKALGAICSQYLNSNTLFWLDAHFPGADNHLTSYDSEINFNTRVPLKAELEIIKQRADKFKDAVIIDDLWLYEEGPFEWGTFNEHMMKYHKGEKREQICGQDSSFIYDMFKDTHNIKKISNHQGYLLLTPKL